MTEHQPTSSAREFSQIQAQSLLDACNKVIEHHDCCCESGFPACSVCICRNAITLLPPPKPITCDQFMEFFRSDTFHEQMSDDDCRELFALSLKGASDFTADFLNDILSDFSVTNLTVVEIDDPDSR